jgi:DNA-binding transcriptional MocR family regulator
MKEPLYIEMARKFASMIDQGIFKVGEKLPSLRTIHKENHVSVGTVLQAFTHLQDLGLITGKEKSGYFVSSRPGERSALPQTIPIYLSEQTVRIDTLLMKLRKERPTKGFISFSNALPDHRLLPFNGIKRAIQHISRDASGSYLSLEDPVGSLKLREAIAKRSFTWGGALRADDVIITDGATDALNHCLRTVTQPGDTVVVQEPCYYGILQSLEFLSLKRIAIPCHSETGIELHDLEDAFSRYHIKACILVSNFNNPTGASLSSDKKKKIAILANKMKIPVIEDNIYGDIFFDHGCPDTIKTYDRNGWVLMCSSFSKSLFPGFRIGWCVPGRFGYEVARFKSMNNGATANFSQRVLLELITSGIYDRHLKQFRQSLQKNMLRTISLIEEHFPAGTKITRPRGGLVLWIELPKGTDAAQIQGAAFQQGIGIAPGEIFSADGSYQNYIRISYCTLWSAGIEKALAKLGALVKNSSLLFC